MSYQKRRYRVKAKQGDRYVFEKAWDAPDGWFVSKAEAMDAWDGAHEEAAPAPEKPAEKPRKRGRPPKAEIETGIVEA